MQYHAAKGETDDACWVWVPARRYLFTGDLIIWQAPNCGNPQKVQRYPVEWAEALEAMAGLDAEWLFPGHGLVVHGRDAVRTVLDRDRALSARHHRPGARAHERRPDAGGDLPRRRARPELATRPYLQANYDHPKFIVRNLLRLWGGWWNGNAADLLPATLAGAGAGDRGAWPAASTRWSQRGRALLDAGDAVLAAHLAEWATRAAPDDRAAQQLKRDVYERRLAEERSLMAQGIYRAAMNDARQALGRGLSEGRQLSLSWRPNRIRSGHASR